MPLTTTAPNDQRPAEAVLIVDDNDTSATSLCRSFTEMGYAVWLAGDFESAIASAEQRAPSLVVTELRIGARWAFGAIRELRSIATGCRIAVATVYPSVASAVRSLRSGVDAYLSKPVTAQMVLDALEQRVEEPIAAGQPPPFRGDDWPSLDRTVWEYINQVFMTSGSMSKAARRLALDRRSLRRMLSKYPPAR